MTDAASLLSEELKLLQSATDVLDYSYRKCTQIVGKKEYTQEDLEALDSFTSRFSRLSDLIVQRTFRLIEMADLDEEGTVRDRINRAEKKGLIGSADSFIEIRELRNTIAHEYVTESKEIVAKALELSPLLLESVELIKGYCGKNYGV